MRTQGRAMQLLYVCGVGEVVVRGWCGHAVQLPLLVPTWQAAAARVCLVREGVCCHAPRLQVFLFCRNCVFCLSACCRCAGVKASTPTTPVCWGVSRHSSLHASCLDRATTIHTGA